MFSPQMKYRGITIAALIVILSLIGIIIQSRINAGGDLLGNSLSMVFRPLESLFMSAGRGITEGWKNLCNLTTLTRENESLREKNAKLAAELDQIKVVQNENVALRQLLALQVELKGDGIPAEIVGRDATNWFERFIINRGKSKGVDKNMVVVAPEGLVGQITILNNNSSTVRTILNPRSAIPVYVVESGTFGVLCGDGTPICTMKFIRNISFLREGNLVVTSGLGEIFPPGLLVGRISNVHGSVDSLSSQARVKPFVNGENLRFVVVSRGKN